LSSRISRRNFAEKYNFSEIDEADQTNFCWALIFWLLLYQDKSNKKERFFIKSKTRQFLWQGKSKPPEVYLSCHACAGRHPHLPSATYFLIDQNLSPRRRGTAKSPLPAEIWLTVLKNCGKKYFSAQFSRTLRDAGFPNGIFLIIYFT
jgi:hypothetical protein